MDWIFMIATVVSLIIVGFILLIFMPKPTVFFDIHVDDVKNLEHKYTDIKKEIDDINDKAPVIPIFGDGVIFDKRFPVIYESLRSIPFVRYAGIINIKPKFEQVRQYGYAKNADNTLRYFYTISHSAALKSGIWVDGAKKFFYEKEWVVADVSREHSLFNKNKQEYTTVLFIDIDRCTIKKGNSPNTDVSKDEVLKLFHL